jgi:hypothetical protein
MINEPLHISTEPDIYTMFSDIVKIAGETYGKELFFTFGPRKEIIESLVAMSKSNATSLKKYPLIALVGDCPITKSEQNVYGEVTCNFIIAVLSDINTKAEQRNKNKYVAELQPVYKQFIESIMSSRLFSTAYEPTLRHELNLKFDYAKGRLQFENAVSNDIIDAIEIKNLKLKIKK